MAKKQYFSAKWQLKNLEQNGIIAGYASVFNLLDNHCDIICPGAFQHCLQDKQKSGSIKLLWQHLTSEPIGVFNYLHEDNYGLYIEAQLLLDLQRGREAYSLLKAKAITGLSIGYHPEEYNIDPHTGNRIITKINLKEISLVTFPANEAAKITKVKADEQYYQSAPLDLLHLKQSLEQGIRILGS